MSADLAPHHRYVVTLELDSIMDPARCLFQGSAHRDAGGEVDVSPPIFGADWLADAIRDQVAGILVDTLDGYVLRVTARATGETFTDEPGEPF